MHASGWMLRRSTVRPVRLLALVKLGAFLVLTVDLKAAESPRCCQEFGAL